MKISEARKNHLVVQEVNAVNVHAISAVIEMREVTEASVLAESDLQQEQIKAEVQKEVAAEDHTKTRIYD